MLNQYAAYNIGTFFMNCMYCVSVCIERELKGSFKICFFFSKIKPPKSKIFRFIHSIWFSRFSLSE